MTTPRIFSPGDVVVLPDASGEPGHKPAGYMLVVVCSCGRNHPASPEAETPRPPHKDALCRFCNVGTVTDLRRRCAECSPTPTPERAMTVECPECGARAKRPCEVVSSPFDQSYGLVHPARYDAYRASAGREGV